MIQDMINSESSITPAVPAFCKVSLNASYFVEEKSGKTLPSIPVSVPAKITRFVQHLSRSAQQVIVETCLLCPEAYGALGPLQTMLFVSYDSFVLLC